MRRTFLAAGLIMLGAALPAQAGPEQASFEARTDGVPAPLSLVRGEWTVAADSTSAHLEVTTLAANGFSSHWSATWTSTARPIKRGGAVFAMNGSGAGAQILAGLVQRGLSVSMRINGGAWRSLPGELATASLDNATPALLAGPNLTVKLGDLLSGARFKGTVQIGIRLDGHDSGTAAIAETFDVSFR